jgi:hypothetical protein
LPAPTLRLPDSFAVFTRLAGNTPYVQIATGPSAARLLGRFCERSPELLAHTQAHLRL